MSDNGDDFVSSRGGSTKVWPKPHQKEPTTNRDKSTLPEAHAAFVEKLECSAGCTLRFLPRHRTLCVPFPPVGIFEMGSIRRRQ
jgi:hypothetical protein